MDSISSDYREVANKMTTDIQINDLHTLFLYLANATLCIPDKYKDHVFKDMACKLHEWAAVPYSELRAALAKFEIDFIHTCSRCECEIEEGDDEECETCKSRKMDLKNPIG